MTVAESNALAKLVHQAFDGLGWNGLSSLTERANEFLEIGVHVLKDQVEHCLPFLVLTLFDIH